MFTVKNNKSVSLNINTSRLSNSQIHRLNSLDPENAIKYLLSFSGSRVEFPELTTDRKENNKKFDPLSKSQGTVLQKLRDMKSCYKSHKPSQKKLGNWIGVEIECMVPYESTYCESCDEYSCGCNDDNDSDNAIYNVSSALVAAGVKRVSVKDDSSIQGDSDYQGVEITVLTTIDNLSVIETVCRVLFDLGAIVNQSCGLHVHLDVRDLSDNLSLIRNRADRLGAALPLLLNMQPESRRENDYCQPVVGDFDGERYSAVNLTSVEKFGTIEVRLHTSTTNSYKIIAWVKLLYQLTRCDALDVHSISRPEQVKELIPLLPDSVYQYMIDRLEKFSDYEPKQVLMPLAA